MTSLVKVLAKAALRARNDRIGGRTLVAAHTIVRNGKSINVVAYYRNARAKVNQMAQPKRLRAPYFSESRPDGPAAKRLRPAPYNIHPSQTRSTGESLFPGHVRPPKKLRAKSSAPRPLYRGGLKRRKGYLAPGNSALGGVPKRVRRK